MASVHGEVDVAVEENVKRRRMTMVEGDADDDEEDVCRICRMTGEDDSPLYYPCACSGSIKYVHQECLVQWLNHSKARQCEVWLFLCVFRMLCVPMVSQCWFLYSEHAETHLRNQILF
jgi:hypothetical protein